MKIKFILFVAGLVVLISSLIGVSFVLNYNFSFISFLPDNPLIYFGIDAFAGLIAIIMSLKRYKN